MCPIPVRQPNDWNRAIDQFSLRIDPITIQTEPIRRHSVRRFDLFIGIKASHRIQNYVEHKKRSLFVLFEVLQTKCK